MSTSEGVIQRSDDGKVPNTLELYRSFTLPNKMKVSLINDPKSYQSQVALDVSIGSMNDPDDLPGLANLCARMLLSETNKCPQQNDFSMYMKQNGGSEDIYIGSDHTTYYFYIISNKLNSALDRFAQLFLEPLLTKDLMDLVINSINLQYTNYLMSDYQRYVRLMKSSASPDHPFSKFDIGNTETLEIIPKQKGIDVRNRLLEFYEKYYSANVMLLCIWSNESLDELESMVVKYFCDIQNKDVTVPVWPDPFKDEHFGTMWYMVPIEDIKMLYASFPFIPDTQKRCNSSTTIYIPYFLGHEGEGSLLSVLRTKDWCNTLKCTSHSEIGGFFHFKIEIDLTEEGCEHIKDIIHLMFQYINMMKSEEPIKWLYDEYKNIMNIKLKKYRRGIFIFELARTLHEYPLNQVLGTEFYFPEWQPDVTKKAMEYLTPQKVRIYVAVKMYENIANETESWYGIKYKKEKISKETMDTWNIPNYSTDLKLPVKNELIPTTFIKLDADVQRKPVILKETSFVRLWHKKDNEFPTPEAIMSFNFISRCFSVDLFNSIITRMYVLLVIDSLKEYTFSAQLAGLNWTLIAECKYKITLTIEGYDDKQHVLLEKIIDRMLNLKIDLKRFEIVKKNYIQDLTNFVKDKESYQLAHYYLKSLLLKEYWSNNELLESVVQLRCDVLQSFIPLLFSKVFVECLIYGNVTRKEAIDAINLIESKLTNETPYTTPLEETQLILNHEIRLKDGCHFLFESKNEFCKNSCTMVYFQTDLESIMSQMLLALLVKIIEVPYENTLRNKERLGHVVHCFAHNIIGAGLGFLIQGDKHPRLVEKRIDLFLHSMMISEYSNSESDWIVQILLRLTKPCDVTPKATNYIFNMSQEEFNNHKEALNTFLLKQLHTLYNRGKLFWKEINTQNYDFKRIYLEIGCLSTLTQQQLVNFFEENVLGKTRRKLSIHVISTISSMETNFENTENVIDLSIDKDVKKIDDITSFKSSQVVYPLVNSKYLFQNKEIKYF